MTRDNVNDPLFMTFMVNVGYNKGRPKAALL